MITRRMEGSIMKRWLPLVWIIISAFLLLGFRAALLPSRFTGEWYSVQTGTLFLFSEGFILQEPPGLQNEVTGAYIFSKNKILLFSAQVEGLENPTELRWIRKISGDFLCETRAGTEKILFSRNCPKC